MVALYQFPISHYCEKVRWALDYKNINYQAINLLPGLHAKTIRKMTKSTEVPVLKHNNNCIANSSNIISYLDDNFKKNSLTPADAETKAIALEWENFVDQEIGPHLRVYFYHTLLDYPDLLIPLFAHNGPWYGKIILKLIFPKLRKVMRSMMRINDKSALRAKLSVEKGIAVLNQQLSKQAYLAGEEFTRADLAAASLLAPVIQAEKYGMDWPKPLPEPLQKTIDEWHSAIPWVDALYENYR